MVANTDQATPNSLDAFRRTLDEAPMSRGQWMAVLLTIAICTVDGYDVLSVTFAAPAIAQQWGIGKAALGLVLAGGLAGMALGSFFVAPLADVIGRRKMIILCLPLMALGMLGSAYATNVTELIALRVFTGIWIGACISVINPMAAEFANARWRSFAVSAMAMGYPLGGTLGGLIASVLLHYYDWPAVFLAGAIATILLLPLVLLFLPEPLTFILGRNVPNRMELVNARLRQWGREPVADVAIPAPAARRGYALVFAADQRRATLRVTAVNLLLAITAYYVLSWLPQMVTEAGFEPSSASLISAGSNVAGIVGGLLLGWAARAGRVTTLGCISLTGLGLGTAALGLSPASLPIITLIAVACGFFLFASSAANFALIAHSFTPEARASGTGFVIGVGRIGSAIAPALAGFLFQSGFGPAEVSIAFGLCAVGACLILLTQIQAFSQAKRQAAL